MSAVPLPLLDKWPVVAVKSEKWYLQIFNGKAWKEFFKMKLLKVPGKPPITAEEAGMG